MLNLILLALLIPGWGRVWAGNACVSIEAGDLGIPTLEGQFTTTASKEIVWQVLTDYENLPKFVSSMKISKVQQHNGNSLMLEQTSIGHVLFFRKTIYLLLNVQEQPMRRIDFKDVAKTSFEFYQGFWEIENVSHGVLVTYQLKAKGGFVAPQFLTKGVSRKIVTQLLNQVQAEMERRSSVKSYSGRFVAMQISARN